MEEKAQAMQAWNAVLKDWINENNELVKLEDYLEYPDEIGAPLDPFFTPWVVIRTTIDETKKAAAATVKKLTTNTVQTTITSWNLSRLQVYWGKD